MSRCPAYSKSCPEPVSTVNVSVTQISMSDGNIDLFRQENLSLTQIDTGIYTATLTKVPYTDEALTVYLNGTLLKPGRDYNRAQLVLTFTLPAEFDPDTSTVSAVYIGTDYARLETAIQPGMIVGAATASGYSFVGFLPCNGASYLRSAKPALFAAIGTTYGEGSDPGNTFQVPDVDSAYVDGLSNFNTGPAYIKE